MIPSTQWDCGPLCNAQIFLPPLPSPSASISPVYGTESQAPIIYSGFMFWWAHRVFPFVMLLCAQIKLGIMLYLSTMKPCHSALRDNIKCHVRVHLQNKITAFGGPLNSCCTLHLMYYARERVPTAAGSIVEWPTSSVNTQSISEGLSCSLKTQLGDGHFDSAWYK